MKKISWLLFIILITSLTAGAKQSREATLHAAGHHPERIQHCSALLPPGHKYKIDIQVSVDKKTDAFADIITKQLNISDDTNKTVDNHRKKEVQPFIQCIIDNVL